MSSTGTILRTAKTIAHYYSLLTDGPHYAAHDGRLHPAAVIYRAATSHTPNAFLTDADASQRLIEGNPDVAAALRWISAVLPTEPPVTPETGDDHLEHLNTWWDEPDFFLGRRPNTCDFIGLLDRAAQTADTLTDVPAPRPPLAA